MAPRTRNTTPASKSPTEQTPPRSGGDVSRQTKTLANRKRARDGVNEVPASELEQPAPTKKTRTTTSKNLAPQPEPDLPATDTRRPTRKGTSTTKGPEITQKRKRRTKAQIAADNAAAEAEKQRLEDLAKARQIQMAQMDLEEDINRQAAEVRAIRRFSDLDQDTDGEEFKGYHDIPSDSDSSSAGESARVDLAKPSQDNIKALQKRIDKPNAKVDGDKTKKSTGGGGKKTKRVTFASGLRSDWNTQARTEAPRRHVHVEIISGGLHDSDIEDTTEVQPLRKKAPGKKITEAQLEEIDKNAKRDPSRQNELVAIISSESESEEDFVPQPRYRPPPPKPAPSGKKVVVKTRTLAVKNDPELSLQALPSKAAAGSKPRRLNTNNVRITDLPDFMKPQWRKVLLPTVYDKFFASSEPFTHFFKGSDEFVDLLQTVVDEVFPHTNYEVTANDALHHLSYNRINEKRSNIGSSAIEIVKQHINTVVLTGERDAREWIRWALRGDGPLFFRVPAPANSPSERSDPRYEHPEGRLLSRFIIKLITPSLRLTKGSVSENGYPRGLVALIMAALERAVRSLLLKPSEIKEFSNEFWGSKVKTYHSSLRAIEEAGWKELFDECGLGDTTGESEDENDADLSLLDNNRAFLFDHPSPVKRRD